MTKSELIKAIAARLPQLSQQELEQVVNAMLRTIVTGLQRGERIEIRGFGSFTVRERRSRVGRNPKTGAPVQVPRKRVPFFVTGHALKQRVDGTAGDLGASHPR